MNLRLIVKIIVDAAMTIMLFILMGYHLWGNQIHEPVGICIFILFTIHHVLNFNWYRNMFKRKYSSLQIIQNCLNLLLLIVITVLIYSGVGMSRYIFGFISFNNDIAFARKLHIIASYWSFILMSLHIGLHWNIFIVLAKKKLKAVSLLKTHSVLFFIIGLLISVYGVYIFEKRDFYEYMFLKTEFVFFDYAESKILFGLDYMSLMGTCIFVSHYISKFLKEKAWKQEGI